MINKINILITLIFVISLCVNLSFAQNYSDTNYIKKHIKYSDYYDFVNFDQNMVEWYNIDAVSPLFEKLKNVDKEKVVLLHIGDSHLQSDIGAGVSRQMLQGIFGYGGRGLVFPYQAAGTHSTYDYFAKGFGSWAASKNVELKPKHNLGISGITIFTTDTNAGFTIVFRKHYFSIQPDFRKIKLYCHQSDESYDATLTYSAKEKPINIDCNTKTDLPYIEIEIPKSSDTLTFTVKKTKPTQKYFECYGIGIENVNNSGIVYNSVGINGAGFRSVFSQNLMKEQLLKLKPDVIILDIGINDFFRGKFNYQFMMSSLNKAIEFFRSNIPDVCIIVPNAQDIYFRGANVKNCEDYSVLSRLVCKEQNVALYDYYNISGGRFSMLKWSKNGLSQRDRTHLSFKGYKLKGELYCNAILNSYLAYLKNKPDSFIAFNNKIDTANFAQWVINKSTYYNKQGIASSDKIDSYKNQPIGTTNVAKNNNQNANPIYYKIKNGDNLGKIAAKYGVSVGEIQRWNNMSSSKIYAGKVIKIFSRGYRDNLPTASQLTKSENNATTVGNKTIYKIQPGDLLGKIASKYGVSVAEIKKWNNLSSDNITAGKTLVIYSKKNTVNSTQTAKNSTSKPATNSSQGKRYHTVQKGETLWTIAKKYNTSVDKIKKNNKMKSDKINIGSKLIIM